MQISVAMSNAGMQTRIISDLNMIEMLIDTPEHTIQGFIVNLKCENIDEIFLHGDHRIIFKDNNLWLFIDDDVDKPMNESIVNVIFQGIEQKK